MSANAYVACCCNCASPNICASCTTTGDYTPKGYTVEIFNFVPSCCSASTIYICGEDLGCGGGDPITGAEYLDVVPTGINGTFGLWQQGTVGEGYIYCGVGTAVPDYCEWDYGGDAPGEMRLYGPSASGCSGYFPASPGNCSDPLVPVWDRLNPKSRGTFTAGIAVRLNRIAPDTFTLRIYESVVYRVPDDDPACCLGGFLRSVTWTALLFSGKITTASCTVGAPFTINNGTGDVDPSHPLCNTSGFATVTPCIAPPPPPGPCSITCASDLACCDPSDPTPEAVILSFGGVVGNPKCSYENAGNLYVYKVLCELSGLQITAWQDPDLPCKYKADVTHLVSIMRCVGNGSGCGACDPYLQPKDGGAGVSVTLLAILEYDIAAMNLRVVMTVDDPDLAAGGPANFIVFFPIIKLGYPYPQDNYNLPCCRSFGMRAEPPTRDSFGNITDPTWNSIVGEEPFGGVVAKDDCAHGADIEGMGGLLEALV